MPTTARLGLPEATLRISVVLGHGTVRHAVLTVATDRGDFVLDSLKDEILAPRCGAGQDPAGPPRRVEITADKT